MSKPRITSAAKRLTINRSGIKDIWNAFLVDGANWSVNDIPYCPTTATCIPHTLVSYRDAISIHNKAIQSGNKNYHVDAYVHFWIDDQKFDGVVEGIWSKPHKLLKLLRHFSGVITPDFSTCADFPDPLCRWNTYRMRALGFWLGKNGIAVINNVRWGNINTWSYCFDGIIHHSIIAIGTTASNPYIKDNRPLFEDGLLELIKVLEPKTIIVYGSAKNKVFDIIRSKGIHIIAFPGQTFSAFERRKGNE